MRAPSHPEVTRIDRRAATPRLAVSRPPQGNAPARQRPAGGGEVPGGSLGLRSDRAVEPSQHSRSAVPAEPNPLPQSIRTESEATARPANPRPVEARPAPQRAAIAERYRGPVASFIGEAIPDLTKLPGVSVLRGEARVAAGAAARTRAR
jgi:hypothetical protein